MYCKLLWIAYFNMVQTSHSHKYRQNIHCYWFRCPVHLWLLIAYMLIFYSMFIADLFFWIIWLLSFFIFIFAITAYLFTLKPVIKYFLSRKLEQFFLFLILLRGTMFLMHCFTHGIVCSFEFHPSSCFRSSKYIWPRRQFLNSFFHRPVSICTLLELWNMYIHNKGIKRYIVYWREERIYGELSTFFLRCHGESMPFNSVKYENMKIWKIQPTTAFNNMYRNLVLASFGLECLFFLPCIAACWARVWGHV